MYNTVPQTRRAHIHESKNSVVVVDGVIVRGGHFWITILINNKR